MQGILKFKLPEESEEFKNACTAGAREAAINEFDNWLRSEIKYSGNEDLAPVREKLYQIFKDYDIQI